MSVSSSETPALEWLVEEQPSAPIACIIGRVSSDQFETSPSVMKTYWWVIFYPHRSNWHSSGSGKWADETAFYHDTPYGRKYLYVWKLFEMQYPRQWGNVNLSIVEGGIEDAWDDTVTPTVPWHCHGVYTNIWHIVVKRYRDPIAMTSRHLISYFKLTLFGDIDFS